MNSQSTQNEPDTRARIVEAACVLFFHSADALVVHRTEDPRVVIVEYDVHGKIVATGVSYDNRLIAVITIEDRKIVHWRDYLDSLAAMTALSQPAPDAEG